MMGSHIDTVATGGKYDGNLGVLAALEVIETAIERGIDLQRPLAAAFFTNEEGSRFPPDMMGSLCYTGGLTVEEAMSTTDADGVSVGDELDRIGYRGPTPCPGSDPLRLRGAPHRAGAGAGARRHAHRSGHRRPGHLLDRGEHHRPVESRRHHTDEHAPGRGSSCW